MTQTVETEIKVGLPEPVIPIERRNARELPYQKFVSDYVQKNKPVVISDSVPQWSAIREWSPEFFADRFGAEVVKVTDGLDMPMGELMEKVVASTPEKPAPYLHRLIIHRDMPELLRWLTPENAYAYPGRYCSPLMLKRLRRPDGYLKLLIGGPGGKFPFMHYDGDNANAVITEIYGDKAFVMFAPEDSPYLYAKDKDAFKNISLIDDLANPDFERFPLLKNATPYYVVLKPGETIYVPAGWWHAARVVTTSISVCVNMLDSSNWAGHVDWLCRPGVKKLPARIAAKTYLTGLGAVLSVAEGLQRILPEAMARGVASLSPLKRPPAPLQPHSPVS